MRLTTLLLVESECLKSAESITVLIFKKYTSREYIDEFLDGLAVKWNKRFRFSGVGVKLNDPGPIGPIFYVIMAGDNIPQIKQDLRLNPMVLLVRDAKIRRA